MMYLGIDPGVSGGLAFVTAQGDVAATPMPATERDKARAQQEFPSEKVTLKTADALLLALYCMRTHGRKVA